MGWLDRATGWDQPQIREGLAWYLAVLEGRRLPKYQMCRSIPADVRLDADTASLWRAHREATRRFRGMLDALEAGAPLPPIVGDGLPNLFDLKAALGERLVARCVLCAWRCEVDRSPTPSGKRGVCKLEHETRLGSAFPHQGEEDPIRGTAGSGTIFFTSCNFQCCFCQNGDIAADKDNGVPVTPSAVTGTMARLVAEGCHNINFVGGEPTIQLHTILHSDQRRYDLDPLVPGIEE